MVILEDDMLSNLIAVCALVFSAYTLVHQRATERKLSCLTLYQLWFSSQMMDARHYAAPILDRIGDNQEQLEKYIDDDRLLLSVSLVEHFIADLQRLLTTNTIESQLTKALFADAITVWVDRLAKSIYSERCEISFHVGKPLKIARDDFIQKILPIKCSLQAGGPGFWTALHAFLNPQPWHRTEIDSPDEPSTNGITAVVAQAPSTDQPC